jgi:sugar O-acyltransferase (sialic acid O-acetyltransferase NeuD family)
MTESVVIIGAGGFAREVAEIIEHINSTKNEYDFLGYIVDQKYGNPGDIVNGKPILGGFDWLAENSSIVKAVCGVGSSSDRYRLIDRASQIDTRFCNLIHPSVTISTRVSLGEGVIIAAGCHLTTQIDIGNHTQINLDCTIGHDSVLGKLVTLAPGVHVSGKVVIGEGSNIGTGVNIIDGVRIGDWSIIGAGTTVIRDIPPNTTVVGVPGTVIKTRSHGWQCQ